MDDPELQNYARQLQIICAALMMGVLMFAAVTAFLVHGNGMAVNADVMIPAILAGISLVNMIAVTAVASQLQNRPIPEATSAKDYLPQYQSSSIIRWAGLEGAAFMNIVGYMLSAQWWSAIVPAVCLLWMAATFPTADKLNDWLRAKERDQAF